MERKVRYIKKVNHVKLYVTAVTSLLSSILGILYVPVLLMVLCNLVDYITGLWAAGSRQDGGISSYRSMRGIIKKVTMWLLVVVGAIIDQLLLYACQVMGYQIHLTFLVACIVAVWIICNELISILENMVDIGIGLPGFLMPLVCNLKNSIDNIDIAESRENEKS